MFAVDVESCSEIQQNRGASFQFDVWLLCHYAKFDCCKSVWLLLFPSLLLILSCYFFCFGSIKTSGFNFTAIPLSIGGIFAL
jgi:hypothetical protein